MYERAVGPSSLIEVLEYFLKKKFEFICIACHGETGRLKFGRQYVSSKRLAKTFSNAKHKLIGLYVDSCGFANVDNAKIILSGGFVWFASYRQDAPWLKSVALAMLFWLTFRDQSNRRHVGQIRNVVQRLKEIAPGLMDELGLAVYIVRDSKIIDLVTELNRID